MINDGEDIQDQTSQLTQRVYADPRTVARSLLAWWKNQSTKPVPESLQVATLKSRSRVLQEAQKESKMDCIFLAMEAKC